MRPTTSSGGWNPRRVSDSAPVDPTNWVCPLPLRDTKRIVMGHGGGGILSEELIENLFLPAFGSAGGPSRDSDRKSTRLNSSHIQKSRMPSSA